MLETIEVTTALRERPIVKFLHSFLTAFVLASVASAQAVTMPETVRGQPGRLIGVSITYDGDDIRWSVPPQLDSFREFSSDPRDVRLRVQGWEKGTYQLIAVTCKGTRLSNFAVCQVVIGDGVNPPTPPGPTPPGPVPPGPTPPQPPTPTPPTPPIPDDPVARRLRDVFQRDAGVVTEKKDAARALSGFFEAMSGHVKDPSVKTVGDLLADYRAAIPAVLKPGILDGLRKQIAREVADVIGDDATRQIDPDLREKLIKLFEFLALILKLLI